VYLQTLDTEFNNDPILIVAGAATKFLSPHRLSDVMKTNTPAEIKANGIHTMDYRYVDLSKVTPWLFAGIMPSYYTITASAGINGTITPSGSISVF